MIRLHAPEVSLRRPVRLMHPRYPLYIAPKPDHVFVIGATEIESEDTSPASVRSTLELLSAAYSLHSGFGLHAQQVPRLRPVHIWFTILPIVLLGATQNS